MSILITGSEGFLGTHLAQKLHERGETVVGLDVARAATQHRWPVVVGDVTDRALVEQIFADFEVTSIVHCGGISGPHLCNNFPARVFETNVLGTLNLLEVARKRRLSGRIVFLSSSSVYGQAAEKSSCVTSVVERLPLLASEPYGASKVACEAMLRAYAGQEGLDAVSLRVSIVYGAGRTAYCGITEMIKTALAGEPIVLDRGCDLPLPWIYIDDLCDALCATLDTRRTNLRERETLAYNVTGPGYPTFREIASLVQELVPDSQVLDGNQPDKYSMNARKMSLTAIECDLNWRPRVTMRHGVRKLYDHLSEASPFPAAALMMDERAQMQWEIVQ